MNRYEFSAQPNSSLQGILRPAGRVALCGDGVLANVQYPDGIMLAVLDAHTRGLENPQCTLSATAEAVGNVDEYLAQARQYYGSNTLAGAVARALDEEDLPLSGPVEVFDYMPYKGIPLLKLMADGLKEEEIIAETGASAVKLQSRREAIAFHLRTPSTQGSVLVRAAYDQRILNINRPDRITAFRWSGDPVTCEEYQSSTLRSRVLHRTVSDAAEAEGIPATTAKDRLQRMRRMVGARNTEGLVTSAIVLGALDIARDASIPRPDLSPRELEVISLAALDLTDKEIGKRLGIAQHTVGAHMGNILRKCGAEDRMGVILHLFKTGVFVVDFDTAPLAMKMAQFAQMA